jgi:hypothetical protein
MTTPPLLPIATNLPTSDRLWARLSLYSGQLLPFSDHCTRSLVLYSVNWTRTFGHHVEADEPVSQGPFSEADRLLEKANDGGRQAREG